MKKRPRIFSQVDISKTELQHLRNLFNRMLVATSHAPLEFLSFPSLCSLGSVSVLLAHEIPRSQAWEQVYSRYFLGFLQKEPGSTTARDSFRNYFLQNKKWRPVSFVEKLVARHAIGIMPVMKMRPPWRVWLEQLKEMHCNLLRIRMFQSIMVRNQVIHHSKIHRYCSLTKCYVIKDGPHTIYASASSVRPYQKYVSQTVMNGKISHNKSPGHFIQAILNGTIRGSAFGYRDRSGQTIWYKFCRTEWLVSADKFKWEPCRCVLGSEYNKILGGLHTGSGLTHAQVKIVHFMASTSLPAPPYNNDTNPAFVLFDSSPKHVNELSRQELCMFRQLHIGFLLNSGEAIQPDTTGHADNAVFAHNRRLVVESLPDSRIIEYLQRKIISLNGMDDYTIDLIRVKMLESRISLGLGHACRINKLDNGNYTIHGRPAEEMYPDNEIRRQLIGLPPEISHSA